MLYLLRFVVFCGFWLDFGIFREPKSKRNEPDIELKIGCDLGEKIEP
jgi:hypothetical protein